MEQQEEAPAGQQAAAAREPAKAGEPEVSRTLDRKQPAGKAAAKRRASSPRKQRRRSASAAGQTDAKRAKLAPVEAQTEPDERDGQHKERDADQQDAPAPAAEDNNDDDDDDDDDDYEDDDDDDDEDADDGQNLLLSAKQAKAPVVCAGCSQPIRERYLLEAIGKRWHEDCLKCAGCECRLGEVGSSLYTHDERLWCRRDFLRIYGQPGLCAVCKAKIQPYEFVMKANKLAYHMDCFACQHCRYRFCVGDGFYLADSERVVCVVCHSDSQQVQHQHQHQHQQPQSQTKQQAPAQLQPEPARAHS